MTSKFSDITWQLTATDCNQFVTPEVLPAELAWFDCSVPATVAESISKISELAYLVNHIESKDWWYRCQFDSAGQDSHLDKLIFEGLATLAEVWLNGEKILDAENMFVEYLVDIQKLKLPNNQLVICFRSVENKLKQRQPRPGWKTKLVNNQNLRWFRTSLLGRIPGWTPPVVAVGPWKPIHLKSDFHGSNLMLETELVQQAGLSNLEGIVHFKCDLHHSFEIEKAELYVGDDCYPLNIEDRKNDVTNVFTRLKVSNPQLWWPHTHGKAFTYDIKLKAYVKQKEYEWQVGEIGFRKITLDQSSENFRIQVNDKSVFCRGACWTINDNLSLTGNLKLLEQQLVQFRQAGGNMLRVVGTMVYESEKFYQLCNKFGIMVWQDFMFANMDYPLSDEKFRNNVNLEIEQQVARLSKHPSLVMFCGNSEIQQQIAMLGFSAEHRQIEFFDKSLADLIENKVGNAGYISSSPFGGDLPFRVNKSVSHYYGIGAYLRSASEIRQHDVKFTSECLGFANVPQEFSRNKVLEGEQPKIHDPRWKAATPRDSGAGWDFEDVRDFYLNQEFTVDPQSLRYQDPEKYIQLSELVSGLMMGQAFAEWRSNHSNCAGGIVWFLKDIALGAGWGLYDSLGYPKACFYELKRHWQPVELVLTNENINGIDAHIINEKNELLAAQLVVKLINQRGLVSNQASHDIQIDSHQSIQINLESVLGGFNDIAYAYRFGAASHQAVCVELFVESTKISEAYINIEKAVPKIDFEVELSYKLKQIDDSSYELSISSNKYLVAVTIKTPGFIAEDNFFNLQPESAKKIILNRHCEYNGKFKGYLTALNFAEEIKLRLTHNEVND